MNKLTIILLLCIFCTAAKAHVVVDTKYNLKYENKHWELDVVMKTAAIYEKVIALHPELAGESLTSSNFKESVMEYLSDGILLTDGHNDFLLNGEQIILGGHYTRATLNVAEMPKDISKLDIKIDCFTETKAHIVNQLFIYKGEKIQTHYFNEEESNVLFDFEKMEYVEVESEATFFSNRLQLNFYILFILIAASLVKVCADRKCRLSNKRSTSR
ncbi:MAG: hypothetical protein CMO01_05065 [Thalassobius sp.]|nr:hypothetical protein [Thalassovita sp.]